ncbi:CRISPR-associated endonuclease Cas1, partial [Desulfobulbus sp. F1]|nr:CRISPR-associated endonuclease Cas1 [Desulfobulbus sp. F1]
MKTHLNTLFVTTQGAYLAKDGETVAVRVEGETKLRLPVHTLGGIVCFGNVGCSPFLLGFCGEKNVAVSFLDEHGRFLARVIGPVSGNVLLRREQYRKADDLAFSARMARAFLSGKVGGSRNVLLRVLRDHGDKVDVEQIKQATDRLGASLRRLQEQLDLDAVRGVEGDAAHVYFQHFDHLILRNKE